MNNLPSYSKKGYPSNKLANRLSALPPEDLKLFRKFLQSSWFNGSQVVLNIFDKIKNHYPHFDSPKLEYRSIFKKVFPKEKYNEKKLRNYLSNLTVCVEKFMAQKAFEENRHSKEEYTALYLGKHHRYDQLKKHHRARLTELKKQPIKGMQYFKHSTKLLEDLYFHPDYEKLPDSKELLSEAMKALDREYAIRKLFLASEVMNTSYFLEQKTKIPLLAEVQGLVETFDEREHPVFVLYLNLSRLLKGGDDKILFSATMQLALGYFDQLEYMERTAAISLLINHAFRNNTQPDDLF